MVDHVVRWDLTSRAGDASRTIRLMPSDELDLATAPCLDEALRAGQRRTSSVTLDLRGLSFMDCSSLSLLAAAADRARANDAGFRVVRASPIVERLLLTAFDRQLEQLRAMGPS
jgi:anti-anti-sigma factor